MSSPDRLWALFELNHLILEELENEVSSDGNEDVEPLMNSIKHSIRISMRRLRSHYSISFQAPDVSNKEEYLSTIASQIISKSCSS